MRRFEGMLEVDVERGVIYFHGYDGMTRLRICQLKIPPNFEQIDITHMHGMSTS